MANIKKEKSQRVFLALQPAEFERFEYGRNQLGLKPSAYVRFLMEHQDEAEPKFLKYKELVQVMSGIDTSIRAIASTDMLDDNTRRELYTKLDDIHKEFAKYVDV